MDWDDSYPESGEESWDDDSPTITVDCRQCGAAVYEDAEQCPSCGEWIVSNHSPWQGRSAWWIVLGGLGVVATIAVLGGLLSVIG
ncbi:MAG: hypothetical protein CMJ65_07920 [Planctomycetaceae bacterium]|jgi:ribosomal protein L37E|nr:hypothetical protein [Planctomycetaceae bacterium]